MMMMANRGASGYFRDCFFPLLNLLKWFLWISGADIISHIVVGSGRVFPAGFLSRFSRLFPAVMTPMSRDVTSAIIADVTRSVIRHTLLTLEIHLHIPFQNEPSSLASDDFIHKNARVISTIF